MATAETLLDTLIQELTGEGVSKGTINLMIRWCGAVETAKNKVTRAVARRAKNKREGLLQVFLPDETPAVDRDLE